MLTSENLPEGNN